MIRNVLLQQSLSLLFGWGGEGVEGKFVDISLKGEYSGSEVRSTDHFRGLWKNSYLFAAARRRNVEMLSGYQHISIYVCYQCECALLYIILFVTKRFNSDPSYNCWFLVVSTVPKHHYAHYRSLFCIPVRICS